jgi:hypothetical protein
MIFVANFGLDGGFAGLVGCLNHQKVLFLLNVGIS